MGTIALAAQVARLYDAIRLMYPERDWAWLRSPRNKAIVCCVLTGVITQRLYANAEPTPRPAPPFDSMALQDLGLALMAEAETKFIASNGQNRREARAIAELHARWSGHCACRLAPVASRKSQRTDG